jgi:hypothetical protein
MIPYATMAQTGTGKKMEQTGKDLEKANEAVDKGKDLVNKFFKNKKKDQDGEVSKQDKSDPSVAEKVTVKENNGTLPHSKSKETSGEKPKADIKSSNQLKPGDVHPNAAVLDVDELFPFYDGAAIVRKGTSTALINGKGELIFPFNKYVFDGPSSKNGFFVTRAYSNEVGFANAKGKFFSLEQGGASIYGKYLHIISKSNTSEGSVHLFYDNEGNKYTIKGYLTSPYKDLLSEDLMPFGKDNKNGYKNLSDQVVVQPIYRITKLFSDGAAVVSSNNEFGEMKYGFIDTKGNAITELKFSRPPESFTDGLAKVYYNEPGKYGFINKKGEVVFSEVSSDQFGPFIHGYSYKSGRTRTIMDKDLKQYSMPEFFSQFGIIAEGGTVEFPSNDRVNVNSTYPVTGFSFYNGKVVNYGYIFWDDKSAVYGKFRITNKEMESTNEFDKVSGLKYAVYQKSLMADDVIEGYINKKGVFMIIKGEKSKW